MAGNRLMLRLAGIFGPPSEGVSLGAGIFRISTDLPSFMRNIMMGRLVSLRRRSRMGLGSGDSHPSFNFYVQYYVEATSGKLVPTRGKPRIIYPRNVARVLSGGSCDPRWVAVADELFWAPVAWLLTPARLCFTSYRGLLLLGLLSKYYVSLLDWHYIC